MEIFARSTEIVCPTDGFTVTFGSPRSEAQTDDEEGSCMVWWLGK